MAETTIESALTSFGLTEYESRAYVTLLTLGTATADELSRRGKIPLPRVYDTLTELQRKGFVLIGKARPKKFNPIPIEKALNNYLFNQKKDFDDKIKHLKTMIPEVKQSASGIPRGKISETKWNIWTFDSKVNIGRISDEQKIQAKKEILFFAGDLSWIYDTESLLKNLVKKRIKVKILAASPKGDNQIAKNIAHAKKIGAEVKTGYDGITRGHVVDEKIASVSFLISSEGLNIRGRGKPRSEKERSYEMITFDNPILVTVMKENFDFWWNSLK